MRKLIYIFLFFSLVCNSQPRIVIIKEPLDYHEHYWGSSVMNGFIISSLYYKTNRKWLSVFLGTLITNAITIGGKEYVYDKGLKRGVFSYNDIEADVIGSLNCTFVLSMSLINNSRMTKKEEIKYNNLNAF